MKSGVKYGSVCFNPFMHSFITCNISYATRVSAILHYSIFKIALIGLIEALKLHPFSIVPVIQALDVASCASAFRLQLHGRGITLLIRDILTQLGNKTKPLCVGDGKFTVFSF